jgi:hypothetical protein
MKNTFWIVFALIILFLFFTRQGQNITRIFQQSGPLNIDFGSGVYEPGTYVIPDFSVPLVNGVALPPPLASLPNDEPGCCCNPYPTGNVSRPVAPFVSPSVMPSYTPPPQYVSLVRPPPEITLYSGPDFNEYQYSWGQTVPALDKLPVGQKWWNDRAQSLEVKSGTWRVYEHANKGGRSAILAPGRYDNAALRLRGLNKNITGLYLERA